MVDNSKRLAGLGWLEVDGVGYHVMSEPTWGVSTVERTTLNSMGRRAVGYSESYRPGFIAATILDEVGTKVAGFNEMTNVAVKMTLASGKIVSGTGMWCVGTQEVNSTEATLTIRFEGDSVVED